MKKFLTVIIVFIFTILSANADQYGLYKPNEYQYNTQAGEKVLFILDFSNSMSETIEGVRKIDLMLKTMKEILPKINPNASVGLRIYGHRMGLTPYEACRASTLVTPIMTNSAPYISQQLNKAKPRGMTPITFSLKQAIKYDFMGFSGKKHIILLTDGGENCDESPCKFVMDLIKIRKDVYIDVIAFNINDQDDLAQLQCTALVTRGKFYNPKTAAELVDSFDSTIGGMKNVEAKIISPQ